MSSFGVNHVVGGAMDDVQWLYLNDSLRCNPDRRSVGSSAQSDDCFVAMSPRVCNSALSSKAADPSQSLNGWIQSDSNLKRFIPIINIC